jgi:hypothetical protein
MPVMLTDHFLQKHQVRRRTAYRFAQFREDETSVEGGETLVSIDRQYSESANRRGRVRWH